MYFVIILGDNKLFFCIFLLHRLWNGPPLPNAFPSHLHLCCTRRPSLHLLLHRLHVGETDRHLQQNSAVFLWKPSQPIWDPAAPQPNCCALHHRRRGSPGGGTRCGETGRVVPPVWGLVIQPGPGDSVGRWEKSGLHTRSGWGTRFTRWGLAAVGAGEERLLPFISRKRRVRVWGRVRSQGGIRWEDDRSEHVGPGVVRGGDFPAGSAERSGLRAERKLGGMGRDRDGATCRRSVHLLTDFYSSSFSSASSWSWLSATS